MASRTGSGFLNQETKPEKHDETTCDAREGDEELEEEEELFEINLEEAVDPPYDWGKCPAAATGSVLMANCLLPAAEVSGAVPTRTAVWTEFVRFGVGFSVDGFRI
ncbi:PREDICTED: uncharacterized protein LOC104804951 [Tarenaya hassleriana]|uniref:uncharacterized protein LOC104804951 n=1 Tax=Tarenaya hassleriana TaxID=28532 RepID=UPI00053C7FF3|nr:PREDICTED: uncharacterized protein LOC104804951 [Tarenaya hassleriana]